MRKRVGERARETASERDSERESERARETASERDSERERQRAREQEESDRERVGRELERGKENMKEMERRETEDTRKAKVYTVGERYFYCTKNLWFSPALRRGCDETSNSLLLQYQNINALWCGVCVGGGRVGSVPGACSPWFPGAPAGCPAPSPGSPAASGAAVPPRSCSPAPPGTAPAAPPGG